MIMIAYLLNSPNVVVISSIALTIQCFNPLIVTRITIHYSNLFNSKYSLSLSLIVDVAIYTTQNYLGFYLFIIYNTNVLSFNSTSTARIMSVKYNVSLARILTFY
jgi:hypothetical protein